MNSIRPVAGVQSSTFRLSFAQRGKLKLELSTPVNPIELSLPRRLRERQHRHPSRLAGNVRTPRALDRYGLYVRKPVPDDNGPAGSWD